MTPPVVEKERVRKQIDPRMSARRTEVLRRQGQRRMRLLIFGLGAAALVATGWFVIHSPMFSARHVTVTGNAHETVAQVVTQAGLARHPPLLDVNTGAAAAQLQQLPWVRSATVQVSWPDSVHIAVTEEVPKLVVAVAGSRWALLSADGRVVEVTSGARPPGLLLMTVPQAPGAAGTTLPERDDVGLRVATTLPASFAAQVTGVAVEPAGWVQLSMTTPIAVDVGSASQLTAKYEDVSSILAGATLHNGDVIDVSVPDAPTVTSG